MQLLSSRPLPTFLLLLLTALPLTTSIPAPTPTITASPISRSQLHALLSHPLHRRQSLPDLLALAESAGIPLPTNPAALLSLYPLATELLHYLPTAPVLAALETAAPPDFLSRIVHDPAYAASVEGAFATGVGPDWFAGLPNDVKGYLHTFEAGGLVSEVAGVESALSADGNAGNGGGSIAPLTGSDLASAQSAVSAALSGLGTLPHSIIGESQTGSAQFGPLLGTGTASGSGSGAGIVTVTGSGAGSSGVVLSGTNAATTTTAGMGASSSGSGQASAGMSATNAGAAGSSTVAGAAAQETGMLAAGVMAAMGVMGVVAIL